MLPAVTAAELTSVPLLPANWSLTLFLRNSSSPVMTAAASTAIIISFFICRGLSLVLRRLFFIAFSLSCQNSLCGNNISATLNRP